MDRIKSTIDSGAGTLKSKITQVIVPSSSTEGTKEETTTETPSSSEEQQEVHRDNGIQSYVKTKVETKVKEHVVSHKVYYIFRVIMAIASFGCLVSGMIVIIASLFSYLRVPYLSTIITRLLMCGGGLIGLGFSGICALLCNILCQCCCKCCRKSGDTKLVRVIVASYSLMFELLCFGLLFVAFEGTWQDMDILKGSKTHLGWIYPADGKASDIIDDHYFAPRLAGILCVAAVLFVFVIGFLSLLLLRPQAFKDVW